MSIPNKVLLIEDDKKKIEDIRAFLSDSFNYNDLVVKESYQSGLRELIFYGYDLLLLDMSIPTWDKSPTEPGGNFEKFGGFRILKEIVRKGKPIRTILISMFDNFGLSDGSVTLEELDKMLKNEFPDIYQGAVYYNARENQWKVDLEELLITEKP